MMDAAVRVMLEEGLAERRTLKLLSVVREGREEELVSLPASANEQPYAHTTRKTLKRTEAEEGKEFTRALEAGILAPLRMHIKNEARRTRKISELRGR